MDGVAIWIILRWIICAVALIFALGTMVLIWRIRGLFNWRISLKRELEQLKQSRTIHHQQRSAAIDVVLNRCLEIRRSQSMDFDEWFDIHAYIRAIASCYNPEHPAPEMRISVGNLISACADLSQRLQLTLNRTFLRRLRMLRIRHIRQACNWYRTIMNSPAALSFLRSFIWLRQMLCVMRWIVLDPVSWVTYLSGRVSMLIMAKSVLLDFYLFLGKLAVEAYDVQTVTGGETQEAASPEEGLKIMAGLRDTANGFEDPRIHAIREELVGFPARLVSPPQLTELKNAIGKSAEILAEYYFPDAASPLEEAAIGPLLERVSLWLRAVSRLEKHRIIRQVYHIPLETVYGPNSFSRLLEANFAVSALKRMLSVYKWMKWPLKLYRWSRKTAPAAIALGVGWELSKKAAANFFCRCLFDRANTEIDQLYFESANSQNRPGRRDVAQK